MEPILGGLPGGRQRFWDIPFILAEADDAARFTWIGPGLGPVTVSLSHPAGSTRWIVLAHFANVSPAFATSGDDDAPDRGTASVLSSVLPMGLVVDPGEHLADYTLEFADGASHTIQVRRRFEVNDVWVVIGQSAFAARPHRSPGRRNPDGPHAEGEWARDQTAVDAGEYARLPTFWLFAIENPRPEVPITSLRLTGTGRDFVGVGGISLLADAAQPFRLSATIRVEIDGPDLERTEPAIRIEPGAIRRRRRVLAIDSVTWVQEEAAGLGDGPDELPMQGLVLEVTATDRSRLVVDGAPIPMKALLERQVTGTLGLRINAVPEALVPVEVTIIDAGTGQLSAARVRFLDPLGRYFPPMGHRHDVKVQWMQDQGADLRLGRAEYAYVPGKFQVNLPLGEVHAEVVRGFEHQPLRRSVNIGASNRELSFAVERPYDWRRDGWITADTHVHNLSPHTALLEAEAEGVNIVNLLATQWGDFYTNVGDFTGEPLTRGETIVWVGTENRQHILGHLNALGTRSMIVPLSSAGPPEAFLGDPATTGLIDWARSARAADGIAVVPHFHDTVSEAFAAVVLGEVDALELRDFGAGVDSLAVAQWYALLDAGYRIAAAGGTDKMSPGMPVGGVRTYAWIDDRPVSFSAFAAGVRSGRTFTSSGPLIDLIVEGKPIGSTVPVRRGGTVTVEARAECIHPLAALEIVQDGRVVARQEAGVGDSASRQLWLSAALPVDRRGWVAARCVGRDVAWHEAPVQMVAHTSPVYLDHDDVARPPSAVVRVATMIEGGLTWLDTLATVRSERDRLRMRSSLLEALARLREGPLPRR